LIEAVAFGSLADVEAVIDRGVDLEEQDFWERTAWLVAVQTGDIPKARLLLASGTRRDVTGRCDKPPLFYAIENGHLPMLEWLIDIGVDLHQTDEFDDTALATAAESDSVEAVKILLKAGADVNQGSSWKCALSEAHSREVAMTLLEAGADPQELSSEGRRAILGYPLEPDPDLLRTSMEEFRKWRLRRFGTYNPEVWNNPFWEGMIRSGVNAYQAETLIEGQRDILGRPGPVWCAQRFGQSLTFLPDGRIVQIAGEHEDGSDPDFCIYNDVFVHDTNGNIAIYGYPEAVFPPTDFHTATLIGDKIYLIGSLGYQGRRQHGETPVYHLDTSTFQMEQLETTGDKPGWIHHHRAVLSSDHEIQVTCGIVLTNTEGLEIFSLNSAMFTLNIETLVWTKTSN
jgi:ankyrin repeat protein